MMNCAICIVAALQQSQEKMMSEILKEAKIRHENDRQYANSEAPIWAVTMFKREERLLDHISELQAQLDAVKQGIRAYLDGDAITTAKAEQCPHGLYGYEDCGQCVDEYFEGLFKSERIALLVKESIELQSRIEAVQLEVDNIDDAFAHPDSTSAEAYRNIRQIVSALREALGGSTGEAIR
jgi:hypothetical protein